MLVWPSWPPLRDVDRVARRGASERSSSGHRLTRSEGCHWKAKTNQGSHHNTKHPKNKWRALSARSKSAGTLNQTPNQTGEGSSTSAEHRTHYRSRSSKKTRCHGSADEPCKGKKIAYWTWSTRKHLPTPTSAEMDWPREFRNTCVCWLNFV